MDEERELPTRSDVAAVVCRSYGAFLLLEFLTLLGTIFFFSIRETSDFVGYASMYTSPSCTQLPLGIFLVTGAQIIGREMSGEVELADRRPISRGDLFQLGVSAFGLFCLSKGISQDYSIFWDLTRNGGLSLSMNPLLPLWAAFMNIGGFALAFGAGIRRRWMGRRAN